MDRLEARNNSACWRPTKLAATLKPLATTKVKTNRLKPIGKRQTSRNSSDASTMLSTLLTVTKHPNQFVTTTYLLLLSLLQLQLLLNNLAAAQAQTQAPATISTTTTTTTIANGANSINKLQAKALPDLVSATSDEPIVAVIGQDAFISCVAKNLQNYTIIWRYTNEANAPADFAPKSPNEDFGSILTAGRQRVTSDDRITVIQSHDTWLLKISNVRLSDTGTYVCHTNSDPRVRMPRILSVIKPTVQSQADLSG